MNPYPQTSSKPQNVIGPSGRAFLHCVVRFFVSILEFLVPNGSCKLCYFNFLGDF